MEKQDGEFIGNRPCICGTSSDGMSVYQKVSDDGETYLDGYCRSGFCERASGYISREELEEAGVTDATEMTGKKKAPIDFSYVEDLPFRGWRERRITKTTSEKFGVRSSEDEDGEPIARHYPITKDGELVGYDRRTLPKDFKGLGYAKADTDLFGQSVFPAGDKYLVITTGQEDAMAAAQVLRSEKGDRVFWTPCVSVRCGDGNILKQLKANFEYVSSFEKVIFMFDQDDAAQQYIKPACKLLKPGQAFVATLELKDASDMLKRNRVNELKTAFWKAAPFNRVDILHLNQLWDDFENEDMNEKIPFPKAWNKLNEMMNGGGERGEITLIGALTSIGKGQPLWEQVVTPHGYRNVGDIKVGDQLMGASGHPVNVIGVYPQGVKDVYKLTLNDGSEVYCDDSHLWNWQSQYDKWKGNGFKTSNIHDMLTHLNSGRSRPQVYLPNNPVVEWEEKTLPIDPWLLGILIGDGGLTKNVIITNSEHDIIKKITDKVEEWGLVLHPRGDHGHALRAVGKFNLTRDNQNMNPLYETCKDLGICVKSIYKKIPNDYLHGSPDQRLGLLQGLFDADGHVVKNTASLEYSTSSGVLAEQVKFLVRSLGGTANIIERESFYTKDGIRTQVNDSYRVFIKQPLDMFYFSSEKHNNSFKQGRCVARNEVVNIEKFSQEDTVCFRVDAEDSLYLTNHFIVTHNSSLISNIAYDLIENTDFKVGAMYLEGTKREVVRDLLSLDMSVNLRREKRTSLDMKRLKDRFFDYLAAKDQFVYVDHQGSISNDEIFDKLNYLAKGEDCDVIIIDPVQAAVNSSDNKAVIEFMDTLLKFVKETDTYVIIVSHMKKPDSDNPHDVTEYDLLGSSVLNQIPFNTILMSRDKMSTDPMIRNATKLQMPKCRRTGETGEAGWLRFDIETTHMFATSNPYEEATLDDPQEDDPDFFSEDGVKAAEDF